MKNIKWRCNKNLLVLITSYTKCLWTMSLSWHHHRCYHIIVTSGMYLAANICHIKKKLWWVGDTVHCQIIKKWRKIVFLVRIRSPQQWKTIICAIKTSTRTTRKVNNYSVSILKGLWNQQGWIIEATRACFGYAKISSPKIVSLCPGSADERFQA